MKAPPSQQTPSGGSDQIIVRVLPCAFCGYPFDHELLGKYGCPNCEGEITEKATKQNLHEKFAYCQQGSAHQDPWKTGKIAIYQKPRMLQ